MALPQKQAVFGRCVVVDGCKQPATDPQRIALQSMSAELILDYRPSAH